MTVARRHAERRHWYGRNGNGSMSSEEQAHVQMQLQQEQHRLLRSRQIAISRSDFAAMLDAHANFLRSSRLTKSP